jgi:3-dehydroquinate synthase
MRQLALDLSAHHYNIYIGEGLLDNRELLTGYCAGDNVLILTNETLAPLYLAQVKESLQQKNIYEFVIADGEQYKNLTSYSAILDFLIKKEFRRNDTLLALGGGVIGDLGGFVAASYQRGMGLIQLPTSLLAQVDSSVGGKTAVNHAQGKNLIGAFYQPKAVLIDTNTLSSLPQREYVSGFAEVAKYALLGSKSIEKLLRHELSAIQRRDSKTLSDIIFYSCEKKAQVVAADEKEQGERALLNLGHTFAHALEKLTHYKYFLHGEAVAIGMQMALNLSVDKGLIKPDSAELFSTMLADLKLPLVVDIALSASDILEAMKLDKKNLNQNYRLVLPAESGCVIVEESDRELLQQVIRKQLK